MVWLIVQREQLKAKTGQIKAQIHLLEAQLNLLEAQKSQLEAQLNNWASMWLARVHPKLKWVNSRAGSFVYRLESSRWVDLSQWVGQTTSGAKKSTFPTWIAKETKRERKKKNEFLLYQQRDEKLITSSHKTVSGLTDLMDSIQCMSCVSLKNS